MSVKAVGSSSITADSTVIILLTLCTYCYSTKHHTVPDTEHGWYLKLNTAGT